MSLTKLSFRGARLSSFSRVPDSDRWKQSSAPDVAEKNQRKVNDLLSYDEMPKWHQDNRHIRTGYRPVSLSAKACLQSWLQLHNETMNIYTHLVPVALLIAAQGTLQATIEHRFPSATFIDRLIFTLNVTAVATTLLLSVTYHTFMNHSEQLSALLLCADYAGILLLILASFISGIHVGFYCEPHLRTTYWSMITILSLITAVLVLHPRLQGLRWRPLRTAAFVATGLSGFAPVGHGLWMYGWETMWERSGMPYWFGEGLAYGLGAAVFAARLPERWSTEGWFDVWGSSHQIFHVCVVGGAAIHLLGVWRAWEWNHNVGECGVSF